MKKITRIVGVDCKIGRKSRTGSTVTMSVPDEHILDCTEYFREFESGEDPEGKIKRIELNLIYEDDMMEDEKRYTVLGEEIKTIDIGKAIEQKIVDIDDALTEVVEGEKLKDVPSPNLSDV